MDDTATINATLAKTAGVNLPAPPVCEVEVTAALLAPITEGVLLPLCLPMVLLCPPIVAWLVEEDEVALLLFEPILEVLLILVVPLIHWAKVGKV